MKKRIVAKLAALSLLFTALPAVPVQAVQLPEAAWEETSITDGAIQEEAGNGVKNDAAQEETGIGGTDGGVQEETADGVADGTVQKENGDGVMDAAVQEEAGDGGTDGATQEETGDSVTDGAVQEEAVDGGVTDGTVQETMAGETAKAAGSSGILHNGVTYLSEQNVQAMDMEMQEAYQALCDDIEAGMEEGLALQDAVLAVDGEGTLYCSYYVPLRSLYTLQEKFLPDAEGTLLPGLENGQTPAADSDTSDRGTADGEGTAGGDTVDGGNPAGDTDAADGETEDGETADGDTKDDGATAGDSDAADGELIAVPYEENLSMIVTPAEETFEPALPAETVDIPLPGYGYGGMSPVDSGGVQLYSILPKDSYFSAQLTSSQKKYYKEAEKKLIAGSNQFSVKAPLSLRETSTADAAHAVSALLLEYPEKLDWLAKPGGFRGNVTYKKGAKTGTYTFTFTRSAFYSPELDARANSRVQEVGREAITYAEQNYPDAPVYGIVKYYDQWVCENGYYEGAGAKETPAEAEREVYYHCHSAYGILLNGYGVCESYSKTLARLLDAVGIPNIYAVGTAGGSGHSWNYIQMPDGAWYIQDSTWNDTADRAHTMSDGIWLLKKGDGSHQPSGCYYTGETPDFKFPATGEADYTYEAFALTEESCSLVPKEKHTLSCTKNATGYWTSSNTKAAKVDKKGTVTAVAGGTAVITFAGQGMTASCTVDVDQIKSLKTADTGKTSAALSLAAEETRRESRDILLAVDMGASPHTAQWMVENGKTGAPTVSVSKPDIAEASVLLAGNTVTVHVQAKQAGSTDVTVKFGGKSVKARVTAGIPITSEMFEVTWPAGVTGEEGNKTVPYTGKAVKPKVKKKADEAYKPVKFKVAYVNNTNAGSARVIVTGTGKYGGTIEYPFTIEKIDIADAVFSKALNNKAYNGGTNPPAAAVKLGKKTLKAGRDYELLYTGMGLTEEQPAVLPAGSYTVTARGIGNYTGEMKAAKPYQVTQNTIAKVSVAGAGSVKHTGIPQQPYTVKIGRNILPATDYEIVWYVGQGKARRESPMTTPPIAKGKYTAVVTVKGDNLTTTAKKKEIVKKLTVK